MSLVSGWAILELFGHVRLVGEVSEVEAFGTKIGRIDVLQADGSRVTQMFGGGSVYRITPTTETAAREMVRPYEPHRYSLPSSYPDDYEEVDASFVPRPAASRSEWIHWNAFTDARSDLPVSTCEEGQAYQLDVFVFPDLDEPWIGVVLTAQEGGRLEIGGRLDLQPDTEYHFAARKVAPSLPTEVGVQDAH